MKWGLKRGLMYYLTADIINRNYLYPVAPNSRGCAGLLLAIWLVSFFRTKTRNEFWDYAPVPYEWSRTVGKQYIELFLLIKPGIIKLERKRKKTKKNICTNLRVTSMA